MDLSGTIDSPVRGFQLQTVLTVSTRHMPDLDEDLSPWSFGREPNYGMEWIYAYEEDCVIDGRSIPEWLLNICIAARQKYNANWVLLDPDGDVLDGFPTYDN